MDFGDFISDMAMVGGERRGWRSNFVILVLIAGCGLGAYLGFQSGGVFQAIGYGLLGGFFGWISGVFLLGIFRFALIFVPLFILALGAAWLFGGLG